MTKKTLLTWVMIIVFGLASMPVVGFTALSKQTGNTEISKKKPKKKGYKKTKRSKRNSKKKKGSKRLKSGGKKYNKKKKSSKKKYSKKKYGKKKYGKKKKGSKKRYSKKRSNKRSYKRRYYAPPTNSNKVEYRNYKRNTDENSSGSEMNIEKIAPSKEIRKEPKKEGEQ